MKVIGFCGKSGSGKTKALEYIADLGPIVTMGDVIRNEAKTRNIELSSENLGKIAIDLREKYGQDIVAKRCVELIKSLNKEVVFVDGMRSKIEINVFREEWKFPIVAIELGEQERFNRLLARGRSDDPKSINELRARDKRENNFGLDEVIKAANYTIINDKSNKSLKKNIRKLVKKILKSY